LETVSKSENQVVVQEHSEIVVKKKGQITIPAKIRKKCKIDEGTHLKVSITKGSVILTPEKSFWDLLGSGSEFATVEEMKELLDKLRHEDE
jgi:AbrB family looped-hinge helix DNA binding protein